MALQLCINELMGAIVMKIKLPVPAMNVISVNFMIKGVKKPLRCKRTVILSNYTKEFYTGFSISIKVTLRA